MTSTSSPAKPLLLAAAVFVAVSASSFFFLRNSAQDASAKSRPHGPESRDETANDAHNKPAASPSPPSQARFDLQRERLLETVGSVSSIYLYQTYLNVGLLADAANNDTYSAKDSAEMLTGMTTLLQTVDAQMRKLENLGLDEEEMAAVTQVRKVSALLQSQANHLQAHWKTGEKSSLDQFNQVRRESWVELRVVLGLAGEPAAKTD